MLRTLQVTWFAMMLDHLRGSVNVSVSSLDPGTQCKAWRDVKHKDDGCTMNIENALTLYV